MNFKQLLKEWNNYLNEEVDPLIYFRNANASIEDILKKYGLNISLEEVSIYKDKSGKVKAKPYDEAHNLPGSRLKEMIKGVEFTAKIAVRQNGNVYLIKKDARYTLDLDDHDVIDISSANTEDATIFRKPQ
jgi:hypothetical protein